MAATQMRHRPLPSRPPALKALTSLRLLCLGRLSGRWRRRVSLSRARGGNHEDPGRLRAVGDALSRQDGVHGEAQEVPAAHTGASRHHVEVRRANSRSANIEGKWGPRCLLKKNQASWKMQAKFVELTYDATAPASTPLGEARVVKTRTPLPRALRESVTRESTPVWPLAQLA